MKLTRNFIAEQAKKKQADRWTLAIKDGRHEGTLKSVTVDEKNNRCRMLIKPDDEFMLELVFIGVSILVGVISYKLRIYAVCSFFILFIFELVKEKG